MVATLTLASRQPGAYPMETRAQLEVVTSAAAVSLVNARNYQTVEALAKMRPYFEKPDGAKIHLGVMNRTPYICPSIDNMAQVSSNVTSVLPLMHRVTLMIWLGTASRRGGYSAAALEPKSIRAQTLSIPVSFLSQWDRG